MFTIQYTKDGDKAVAMAMSPSPPIKSIMNKKVEYPKPRTKGRGVSYGKIGLTTVAVSQGLPSRLPLVL